VSEGLALLSTQKYECKDERQMLLLFIYLSGSFLVLSMTPGAGTKGAALVAEGCREPGGGW